MQKSIRFFMMIFPAFFARVNPVSTMAKPACIQNTNAAPIKNQNSTVILLPPDKKVRQRYREVYPPRHRCLQRGILYNHSFGKSIPLKVVFRQKRNTIDSKKEEKIILQLQIWQDYVACRRRAPSLHWCNSPAAAAGLLQGSR